MIRQRSALESKTPFYLQPRVPLPFPLIPSKSNPYLNSMSPAYPYLPTPSTPSTENASHKSPYSVSNLIGETTIKPPQSPFIGYPFTNSPQAFKHPQGVGILSPWSPLQNGLITGLPTPPSNEQLNEITSGNGRNNEKETDHSTVGRKETSNIGNVIGIESERKLSSSNSNSYAFSPYASHVTSFSSPFLYMCNNSPHSPMVLLGSPCGPSSVNSVPSVSSSSGCSSMSEGSVLSVDQSKQKFCRIAPSEYHVGIKPPAQTIISVDGNESDSASHISDLDDSDDERIEVDVERVESYSNLNNSTSVSSQTSNNTASSSSSGISDSCPLSVHSLISSEPQVRYSSL